MYLKFLEGLYCPLKSNYAFLCMVMEKHVTLIRIYNRHDYTVQPALRFSLAGLKNGCIINNWPDWIDLFDRKWMNIHLHQSCPIIKQKTNNS